MFDSENICVCCKHPIVDETIEGDMTLKELYTSVDFNELSGGVDSGCRNCAVILDAISAHVWGRDRSFRQSMLSVHSSPISRGLVIGQDEKIEVIRYSGMSEHYTATFELIVRKTFHEILSLPSPVSGTLKNLDPFRKILLRKRLCV